MSEYKIAVTSRSIWFLALCLGLLLPIGCKTADTGRSGLGVSEACDPGIMYQGKSHSGSAAYGLLGLSGSSEDHALREVSDVMQMYLHQSAMLCTERERGAITAGQYIEHRERLAERFARFVTMVRTLSPEHVKEEEVAVYGETLASYRPDAPNRPIAATMRVLACDGKGSRVLKNGGIMHSGQEFTIEVELSREAHLYIVLKDSSGNIYRLYPALETGSANPVSGLVVVPAVGGRLVLDDRPGTETIYLFAGSKSPSLETELEEVESRPKSPETQILLASAADFRGVFTRKQTTGDGGLNVKAVDQAAAVFTIEHR